MEATVTAYTDALDIVRDAFSFLEERGLAVTQAAAHNGADWHVTYHDDRNQVEIRHDPDALRIDITVNDIDLRTMVLDLVHLDGKLDSAEQRRIEHLGRATTKRPLDLAVADHADLLEAHADRLLR